MVNTNIPFYSVPGNHDVGNVRTTENIINYRKQFGAEYYTFTNRSILGMVLNSIYLHSLQKVLPEAAAEEAWLLKTLAEGKAKNYTHIIVFMHHPFFLSQVDEANQYFNIPTETQKIYEFV